MLRQKFKKNNSISNSLINMMQTWQREWRNIWMLSLFRRLKRRFDKTWLSIRMKKSFSKRRKKSQIKKWFDENSVCYPWMRTIDKWSCNMNTRRRMKRIKRKISTFSVRLKLKILKRILRLENRLTKKEWKFTERLWIISNKFLMWTKIDMVQWLKEKRNSTDRI